METDLQKMLFDKFNITEISEKQPACLCSCKFLLANSCIESFAVGVASLLPCFWMYREVGLEIFNKSVKDNAFYEWTETYASPEFETETNLLIDIVNKISESQNNEILNKMRDAFITACRLELQFWNASYNLESW